MQERTNHASRALPDAQFMTTNGTNSHVDNTSTSKNTTNDNSAAPAGRYVPPQRRSGASDSRGGANDDRERGDDRDPRGGRGLSVSTDNFGAGGGGGGGSGGGGRASKWVDDDRDGPRGGGNDRGGGRERAFGNGSFARDRDGGGGGFDGGGRGGGARGGGGGGGRWQGSSGGGRGESYGGGELTFEELGPRNERVERELFGAAPDPAAPLANVANFAKFDDIPVEVSGDNAPMPLNSWEAEDLGPVIENAIKLSGYVRPTPVQRYSIPVVLAQRDLMSCAQTGSGKVSAPPCRCPVHA
jgi:probable ATP-dependent RNA helicase DDX4